MEVEQQKKAWLAAGIMSYIGLQYGILVITLFLPLTFVALGVTDAILIAEHCGSFKMVAYWTIGLGGITIFFYLLAGIGTLFRSKCYTVFATVLLTVHLLATIALMIWGGVPHEGRKEYLKDMWSSMNETTVDMIQERFTCCGFDSPDEYNPTPASPRKKMPDSCFVNEGEPFYWTEGCYDRVMTTSFVHPGIHVPSDGIQPNFQLDLKKSNPLIAGYAVMFTFMIIISCTTLGFFIYALVVTDFDMLPKQKSSLDALTADNSYAMNTNNSDPNISNKTLETSSSSSAQLNTVSQSNLEKSSLPSTSTSNESVKKENICLRFSNSIAFAMEEGFFKFGILVGKHPKITIVLSLLVAVTLSIGLLQRREMAAGGASFLPNDLEVLDDYAAYQRYFPEKERLQQIIVVDDQNVFGDDPFQKTVELDKKIKELLSTENNTLDTICQKYGEICTQQSLLEFWNFDETVLNSLNQNDIQLKINEKNLTSPIFKDPVEIENIIGDLTRNDASEITAAKAHLLEYITNKPDNDWEAKFVELVQAFKGLELYTRAESSRSTEAGGSYSKELPLLFVGFILVFFYISIMTGKFSLIKHRVWIALLGVGTAGLSLSSGIGLAASITFEWSVLHLIGPFLIIGIGVDDMFILLQAWNTIDNDPKLNDRPVYEKAGFVLKAAGVSITITSVTDLVAFAVGATSALGAFESFSIYTAICIILLFGLQCTFFLACTVLDQQRRDNKKDACCCCIQYSDDYQEGKCANREYFQRFFEDILGKGLTYLPVKALAVILTLVLTSVMAWGFSKLQVGYDPDWYIPSTSYIIPFNQKMDEYFSSGIKSNAFVIDVDFYEEKEKLSQLYTVLKNNENVDDKYLKSWYEAYKMWPNRTEATNAMMFYSDVEKFLSSEEGMNYQYDVVFTMFGGPKRIIASKFPFRHVETGFGIAEVRIMENLREVINEIGFSNYAFPFARVYFNYEIVKIIQTEVYRNLGITMLCVFLMVLPMIASIQMSLWVVLCVIFTILDVAGTMHFIGLYIETSTIITLLLTVGLAVDYAAHIAHKFLTLKGSRNMRMRVSMAHTGPAVFNGGFSTFLALSLLAGSDTYSYKVFFTIFTCVVGYGLWNGLIFLPAVLGFIGPPPHSSALKAELHGRHNANNKIQQSNTTLENPYVDKKDIERT